MNTLVNIYHHSDRFRLNMPGFETIRKTQVCTMKTWIIDHYGMTYLLSTH